MKALLTIAILAMAIPAFGQSYEAVTADNTVLRVDDVKVRMTEPQPAKETLLSVSEVDNQLYAVRNQMEALQKQMNALIAQEVALEALRDKVATEAAKVKLATPEQIE